MSRVAAAIAAVLGLIAGYYAVAVPSCTVFWPQSNMCGILGPVGALIGAGLAFRGTRKVLKGL